MLEFDLEREAFFRAGHVVGAWREGLRVRAVSIASDRAAISWLDVDEPALPQRGPLVLVRHREAARSLIRALLAGHAAQERYCFGLSGGKLLSCRELFSDESGWRALNLLRRLTAGPGEAEALWYEVVSSTNSEPIWGYISAVAVRLQQVRRLEEHQLRQIFPSMATSPSAVSF